MCALAGCFASATSSANDAGQAGESAGSGPDAGADGSGAAADSGVVLDATGIAQDDAPAGCPGPASGGSVDPPVGRLLAGGNSLSARGTTTDGYEVFSDDAAFQLYALPIAGGPVQSIAALGSTFWVTVVGSTVFAWSNVTGYDVGALTAWSSATGAHAIAPASFGILGSTSPDGSKILYVANVDAQGVSGDVYLAGTDGSGATRLLQEQQLGGCFPQLGFAGSYVVVSHCDVPRGAGPSATISSFKGPGWKRVDLIGNAENVWSADSAGTRVLVSTNSGILLAPIGGGSTMTIDGSGFMGQLVSGGQAVVYGTTSGALRRSPTTAPSPTTLTPEFGGFYAIAPSQGTVMYFRQSTSAGGDVYLSSALTPGTPKTVCAAANGAVNGDAFTADSAYALYSTGNDVCTGAATFNAFPVTGAASTLLGHGVWSDRAATGSRVVFNDNYVATGGLRFGRADIESANLASGAGVTHIVSQADAVIDLTPAQDEVIYSWSVQPGPLAGLYIVAIP
jgi:hypothetical protein